MRMRYELFVHPIKTLRRLRNHYFDSAYDWWLGIGTKHSASDAGDVSDLDPYDPTQPKYLSGRFATCQSKLWNIPLWTLALEKEASLSPQRSILSFRLSELSILGTCTRPPWPTCVPPNERNALIFRPFAWTRKNFRSHKGLALFTLTIR